MNLKKHSALSAAALKNWRKSLALTQTEAAYALGLKLRMFQHYEKGNFEIPRSMALACWALTRGRTDFDGLKAKKVKKPLALILAGKDQNLLSKKRRQLGLKENKL